MSPDPIRDGVLRESTNEIARLVTSRKRKLCQLYAVAAATQPVPRYHGPDRDADRDADRALSAGLIHFLAQNDIQKGRYFRESTLPLRARLAPSKLATTQSSAGNAKQPSPFPLSDPTPSQTVEENAVDAQLSPPASAAVTPVPAPGPDDEDDTRRRTRLRTASASTKKPTASLDVPGSTPARLSPSAVSAKARSPGPRHNPAVSVSVSVPDRPSRLRQTDGTSRKGTPSASQEKAVAASGAEVEVNGLAAQDAAETEHTRPRRQRSGSLQETTAQSADLGHAHGEPGSSASSTAGHQSAATPRTELHSPATSPDEEAAQSRPTFSSSESPRSRPCADADQLTETGPKGRLRSKAADDASRDTATETQRENSPPVDSGTPKEHSRVTRATKDAASESALAKTDSLLGGEPEATQTPTSDDATVRLASNGSVAARPDEVAAAAMEVDDDRHIDESKADSRRLNNTAVDPSSTVIAEPTASTGQAPPTPPRSIAGNADEVELSHSPTTRRVGKKHRQSGKRRCSFVFSGAAEPAPTASSKSSGAKDDYMHSMFLSQAYRDAKYSSLKDLLRKSTKSLMTSDYLTEVSEQRDLRILKRIFNLQNGNRWSPRQPKKSDSPTQPATYQDHLLKQMKWLQVDFREERKFKISVAKTLADDCAEWVNSSAEKRPSLEGKYSQKSAGDSDAVDQLAALFRLGPGELHAVLSQSQLGDTIMEQLPLLGSSASQPEANIGKKRVRSNGYRASKRLKVSAVDDSKYDNEAADELEPRANDCALFDLASKPLRDRLTAPYIFKPPTDTRLPEQAFYEWRNASQWTADDDQRLRETVKKYPSNWAYVAENLSPKSLFKSSVDRRTSWECFERYLGIEGPPPDFNRHPWNQQFHKRVETARQFVHARQEALTQQYQAQNPGQHVQIPKKRFHSPVRVERKAQNKRFLAILDAARKLARKRETTQNRQREAQLQGDSQQAQRAANMRKMQEAGQMKHMLQTPQQFSQAKFEREVRERELIQQRKAFELQRRMAAQAGQANGMVGMAQQRGGMPNPGPGQNPAGNAVGMANGQLSASNNDAARQHAQHAGLQMSMANGMPVNAQMGIKGVPQANMQANAQRLHPQMAQGQMTPAAIQQLMQQSQQQSRAFQQFTQQHFANQQLLQQGMPQFTPSMANGGGAMPNSYSHLSAGTNGLQSPGIPTNNTANGLSSSPIMSQPLIASGSQLQPDSQPRPLSSGHIPAVAQMALQIAKEHPHLTPDQIQALASQRLKENYQRQRQNALNAAAGVVSPGANGMHNTPSSNAQQQQQLDNTANSPYQQAALLAMASSSSPGASTTITASQAALAQSQQQQQQQQLRQHMMRQSQMVAGVAMPVNRTTTPNGSMRPPSRSSAATMDGLQGQQQHQHQQHQHQQHQQHQQQHQHQHQQHQQHQHQHQRSASAQSMASSSGQSGNQQGPGQSPRPVSAGVPGGQ